MNDDDRILNLLAERLERPLHDDERKDLDALLAAHPEWRRLDIDFAAAAAHLALEPELEELPDAVKARIVASVIASAPGMQKRAPSGSAMPSGGSIAASRPTRPKPARALTIAAPWIAVAAAAAIAVVGWSRAPKNDVVDLAAARAALQGEAGVVALAWSSTANPLSKDVGGDVVWSASKQSGFMRFHGLAANDPKRAQYQLWIFDADRDERYPVDGGVFDVAANGDTIVAIKARVPVGKATLFAVTVERPGGVVVSKREHIVAVAKVG